MAGISASAALTSTGTVSYLNTNCFPTLEVAVKKMQSTIYSSRSRIVSSTKTLLDTWEGKGAKQFEIEYLLLKQELDDLYDEISDLYDGLLAAQKQYTSADEQISAAITSD